MEINIFLSQRKHARDILNIFHIHNCKEVAIPINFNQKLQLEDGTCVIDPSYYKSLISGLNYLTYTQLDIIYSVSVLPRYMHSPIRQHLGVVKRVLQFIAIIVNFDTWYSKGANFSLRGIVTMIGLVV